MAYDEELAERIRGILFGVGRVSERKMFGGIAFMVDGHMVCGIVGDDLMLRLGVAGADEALDRPHVRPMDFTGRPMTTMVYVGPTEVRGRALRAWVEKALSYTRTLPPKSPKRR
jgi:TfoX/Sxy family transcriptional regulator of competence genes